MQEHVTNEMDVFTNQLYKNEKFNLKRMQLAFDKTERLEKSIMDLSIISSTEMNNLHEKINELNIDINESKEILDKVLYKIADDIIDINEKIESVKKLWENVLEENIDKSKKELLSVINILDKKCLDDNIITTQNITDTNNRIEILHSEFTSDQSSVKNSLIDKDKFLRLIMQRLGDIETFTDPLKYSNVDYYKEYIRNIEKFEKTDINMDSLFNKTKGIDMKLNQLNSDFERENNINKMHVKITELTNNLQNNNELLVNLDKKTDKTNKNFNEIILNNEMKNKNKIDSVVNEAYKSEARIMNIFDSLKSQCFDYIVEKHEEIVKKCIFL